MKFLTFCRSFLSSNNKQMSKYPKEELKKRLTPLQYKVTQENGTEPPYKSTSYRIQMNTIRQPRKEFTTALSVRNLSLPLTTNTIVVVGGPPSMISSKKPTLWRRLMPAMEWWGLKCVAVSVTVILDISLMMDQRTKPESGTALTVPASVSKRNDC